MMVMVGNKEVFFSGQFIVRLGERILIDARNERHPMLTSIGLTFSSIRAGTAETEISWAQSSSSRSVEFFFTGWELAPGSKLPEPQRFQWGAGESIYIDVATLANDSTIIAFVSLLAGP